MVSSALIRKVSLYSMRNGAVWWAKGEIKGNASVGPTWLQLWGGRSGKRGSKMLLTTVQ